jgi:transcriptional regulator with XRE-family HTH domain
MSHRLSNYLATHRTHAGLSQDEVAFLLGGTSGTRVSRYEHSHGLPNLETALAFEAILGVPTRELFAGTFAKVEEATKARAETLAGTIQQSVGRRLQLTGLKLETLDRISAGQMASAESI